MTFAVIDVASGADKMVGTIWADGEANAKAIASDVLHLQDTGNLVIRRAEERELPMKPFTSN